jgi:hypothetical protein
MGVESKQDLQVMEEIKQERIESERIESGGGGGRLEGGTRHSPNTTKSCSKLAWPSMYNLVEDLTKNARIGKWKLFLFIRVETDSDFVSWTS